MPVHVTGSQVGWGCLGSSKTHPSPKAASELGMCTGITPTYCKSGETPFVKTVCSASCMMSVLCEARPIRSVTLFCVTRTFCAGLTTNSVRLGLALEHWPPNSSCEGEKIIPRSYKMYVSRHGSYSFPHGLTTMNLSFTADEDVLDCVIFESASGSPIYQLETPKYSGRVLTTTVSRCDYVDGSFWPV